MKTDYSCIQAPVNNGVLQIPCQLNAAGGLAPFTWTVSNGLLPAGLSVAPGALNSTVIVGRPTAAGMYSFTITVTDSTGNTSSSALSINVAPSQLKVVTPTLLSTSLNQPYVPVSLQATGGVPPYTWSLVPGSDPLPPGIVLNPDGIIYGTPTDITGSNFALLVQDSQTPVPAQAFFPAPVVSSPKIIHLGPSGLDPSCFSTGSHIAAGSPYAFVFSGFDADGPVTVSGSFTSDSHGNLTSGIEDIVRKSGTQLAQPLAAGGSIGFDNSGRGCLTLNTATTSSQFRLTTATQDQITGSVLSASTIEFDDSDGNGTRASGFIRIQDSTAFANPLTGPYAFRLSGWKAGLDHFAMAGVATADTGVFSAITADVNDSGTASGPLSGGNGTFSTVDANGRGTATITVGTNKYHLVYYLVDATHFVLNSDAPASPGLPLISGEATASTGPFSQSSLSNSQIYRMGGSNVGTADLNIGVLHFDGVGGVSGTAFTRTGGTSASTTLSGQYAVDPSTGRFSFSGTAIPAIGYLASDSSGLTAYLLGTGTSAASGVVEFQTSSYPPGYPFSPINGPYGLATSEILDPQTWVSAATGFADLSGDLSGGSYLDLSTPTALMPVLSYELFRYTWNADGTGTFGGNTYMVSNENKIYSIDISPLNAHPALVLGSRWNSMWNVDFEIVYIATPLSEKETKKTGIQHRIDETEKHFGVKLSNLADMEALIDREITNFFERGGVGLKSTSAYFRPLHFDTKISRKDAEAIFTEVVARKTPTEDRRKHLEDYLMTKVFQELNKLKKPIQFHTGNQQNWNLVRNSDPLELNKLLYEGQFSDIKVVITHGGYLTHKKRSRW
ncbi:MAG: Ig domain-containing protein [Acidobacteriia bacterium]|nr:Ig domain-containing protein [Terriglobia bacterium]